MDNAIVRTYRTQWPQDKPEQTADSGSLPFGEIQAMKRVKEITEEGNHYDKEGKSCQEGEGQAFPNAYDREEQEQQDENRIAKDTEVVALNPVFGDDPFYLFGIQSRMNNLMKNIACLFPGGTHDFLDGFCDKGGLLGISASYKAVFIQNQIFFFGTYGSYFPEFENRPRLLGTPRFGKRLRYVGKDSPIGHGDRKDVRKVDRPERRKQGIEMEGTVPAPGIGTGERNAAATPGPLPKSHGMLVKKKAAFHYIEKPQKCE
jgi:hypothetical protein